ncbi:MAG: 2-phospho-L-lactate transferase [Anaerolineae bacterium]|nr:2-phospho-L-lactate transferase [Anaerolineae bacterium]
MNTRSHVTLLVGGVGGAKLAVGLASILPPEALTIIVNTGDDLDHLGLHVSPDMDTVMYTLSGLANPTTGWGITGDTRRALEMITRYGGPGWFGLGDSDLGTNIFRTALLREGKRLTDVARQMSSALGIRHTILPMSDDSVRTVLDTDQGRLAFQEYFVRERWQPQVHAVHFEGAAEAQPSAEVLQAIDEASLIVFGPSNPVLSIDPILALPGLRERIRASSAPCVAVSPIIGGQAVKGPAAKLMAELGIDVSPVGVATHYIDLLYGIILDDVDMHLCDVVSRMNLHCIARRTLMDSLVDKIALSEHLLKWAEEVFS